MVVVVLLLGRRLGMIGVMEGVEWRGGEGK